MQPVISWLLQITPSASIRSIMGPDGTKAQPIGSGPQCMTEAMGQLDEGRYQ